MQKQRLFILASASPHRQKLLAAAGYSFLVVPADVDESAVSAAGLSPEDYARQLALAKARRVSQRHPRDLVVGADTIVDFKGEIIGKPADAAEAEAITRKLFSGPHRVVTGIALVRLSDRTEVTACDVTWIYPLPLTEQQIADHILSGAWQGKSGAYAIQENGDEFIERIDGSLTNVVGLPMELLERLLAELPDTPA